MSRQRILFISSYFPNSKSPNIATYNRQELLALSQYYDIDVVVPISWLDRIRSLNFLTNISIAGIGGVYATYFYTPLFLRNLYGKMFHRSIKRIAHGLAKKNRYDLVYSSWLFPDAWAAGKVANHLGLPLFVSVLGTDVNRLVKNTSLAKRAIEVVDLSISLKCVSRSLKNKLISIGCNKDKLFVLENGIDNGVFYPQEKMSSREKCDIKLSEKVILFVGNLKKEKGLEELCYSFLKLKQAKPSFEFRLIIIGKGQYRAELIKLIDKLNLKENVSLLGERSLSEISSYMNASDVFCLPSYSEGQPNVVMEALSCHTPVVATNVGGTPDLDDGFGNICLVPPKDVPKLTDALSRFIDKDFDGYKWREFKSWDQNATYLREVFSQKEMH